MNPIEDLKLILSYFRIMRKIKPSLIITYTIKPNLYGGTIARILNFAYVINVTGLGTIFQNDGLLKKIVILWYRYASKRAKVLFFENVGNKKEFLEFDIVKNDKCCVLHGAGVNTNYYYMINQNNIT